MKKNILYLCSLLLFTILFFLFKQSINKDETPAELSENLSKQSYILAEIEVLNGCGESGVANLFTNYLRNNNFDVIEIKNADNFNYQNTLLIINGDNKINTANELAKMLNIKTKYIKIDKNLIWDFSIIIGKDYKELESFNTIQKYYSLF